MASSRAVHEVSPDGAGSPAVGPSSNTPIHGFSPEGDSVLADLQNPTEQEATRGVESTQPVTAQAHSCPVRPTAGASEEEDTSSSISEVTAVGIGHRGDPGTRMQTRAREIEDEISRFCADSVNRITVSARKLHNVQGLRAGEPVLRHASGRGHGAGRGPWRWQGQLVDARREIAGLQRQVLVAERPPVGDILGGLAAAPAVGPAHAVLAAGPGVQVATGATPTGSGCSWCSKLRRSGPGGRAGRHPWCWAGWSCRTRWSSSRQGVWRQTRNTWRS
ncbi:hypothetical protein MRX96_020743 [Rhipicephalus microplus]